MIEGGWGYIWAAYAATWLTFGLYGLSLWIRWRRVKKREAETPS